MSFWDIVITANSNLRRSKLRTALTISAVLIGALTLMLTTGVGSGLKSYVDEQVNSVGAKDILIVQVKNESNSINASSAPKEFDPNAKPQGQFTQPLLTDDDIIKIRNTKGIKEVTPVYGIQALYVTTGDKKFQANTRQTAKGVNQPLVAGRIVDIISDRFEVTIPKEFVSVLRFSNNDDALDKTITFGFKNAQDKIFELNAYIVGVQETSIINGNQISTNVTFMRSAFEKAYQGIPESQRNKYPIANAQFDNSATSRAVSEIQQDLDKQGFTAKTLEDILGTVNNVINAITVFLNIFAGIALVAATFGIINTLMMAVQERTREIGLRKAIGAQRKDILLQFLVESIVVSAIGGLAGIFLGWLITWTLTALSGWSTSVSLESVILSFATSALIGVVFGVYPAQKASKLNPIDALRYE